MFFRLISRIFGVLDFILWTNVTIIVTCASFVIINQIKFKFTIYVVGTWILLIVILYICYLTIVASIGLIKATSGKPRDSNARIKLCKFWLNVSWTSFAAGALVLFFFCQYIDVRGHSNDLVVLIINIILRGISIVCVNRYVHEVKSANRQQNNMTEAMTPLALPEACIVSETNETRGTTTCNSQKPLNPEEGLPSYEDVMLKETYDDSSPPTYNDVAVGGRH